MATDTFMASGVMDVDALDNSGPFASRFTSNISGPSGVHPPTYQRADAGQSQPGTSPQGGIDYIDQAVGGIAGIRSDVSAWATSGFRSYRSRTQPFTGSFMGARVVNGDRYQGFVGQQGARATQRALSTVPIELPDRGDVVAGFANPALARMLSILRSGQ